MECPKCKQIKPDNALVCDCGCDFSQKKVEASKMAEKPRPKIVTIIAWLIILTSVLFLVSTINLAKGIYFEPPRPFAQAIALLIFGLALLVLRLISGVLVLKGSNFGRMMYLVIDLISLNLGLILLSIQWAAAIFYFIALIVFTRKSSLEFFGRLETTRIKRRYAILVVVAICFVLYAASAISYKSGYLTLSNISDITNPVNIIVNSPVYINPELDYIASPSFRAAKRIQKELEKGKDLVKEGDIRAAENKLFDIVESKEFLSRKWSVENEIKILLVGLISLVGVFLILRKY